MCVRQNENVILGAPPSASARLGRGGAGIDDFGDFRGTDKRNRFNIGMVADGFHNVAVAIDDMVKFRPAVQLLSVARLFFGS